MVDLGSARLLDGTISAEHWGASIEDEVATHETKTFHLPMGIEKEDRCISAGLWASKLSKAP